MKHLRAVLFALLFLCAGFPSGRGAAFGYAGEPGSGVGPDQNIQATLRVSTHHTHLTRALAYCAGFDALTDQVNPVNPLVPLNAPLAEQIAIYDELTDQGFLTGNGVEWKNWNTTSSWDYSIPIPAFPRRQLLARILPTAVGQHDNAAVVLPLAGPRGELRRWMFLQQPFLGVRLPFRRTAG